jgi:hypothetical protein
MLEDISIQFSRAQFYQVTTRVAEDVWLETSVLKTCAEDVDIIWHFRILLSGSQLSSSQ